MPPSPTDRPAMFATLGSVLVLSLSPVHELTTAVWQVAPHVKARFDGELVEMRPTKPRAVLLIHGLKVHLVRPSNASRCEIHDWQQVKSKLVEALSATHDVFAFGYAQTVCVDAVSVSPGLGAAVAKLRGAGYKEVVLIGHSAGGVIASQFGARFPDAGVGKVIVVAAPLAGAEMATIGFGLPKTQIPFIRSLAPLPRGDYCKAVEKLPEKLEVCCVVCKVAGHDGDRVVALSSQWPAELRALGVPASLVASNHFDAMKSPQAVATLCELANEPLTRWTPEQTELARSVVFGKDADAAALKRADAPAGKGFKLGRRLLER